MEITLDETCKQGKHPEIEFVADTLFDSQRSQSVMYVESSKGRRYYRADGLEILEIDVLPGIKPNFLLPHC